MIESIFTSPFSESSQDISRCGGDLLSDSEKSATIVSDHFGPNDFGPKLNDGDAPDFH